MSAKTKKKKAKTQDQIQKEYDNTLLALQDMQNRSGKKPLTHDQRCRMLNEIYDGTLVTLRRHLMMGVNKGTSAAVSMLERSRLELIGLEDMLTRTRDDKGQAIETHTMGYELSPPPAGEETVKA